MRTSLVKAVAGFVLAGVVYAVPAELNFDIQLVDVLKRAVSPDNTCGALNSNYTCDATINDGGCCSQHGYCGNTTGKINRFLSALRFMAFSFVLGSHKVVRIHMCAAVGQGCFPL